MAALQCSLCPAVSGPTGLLWPLCPCLGPLLSSLDCLMPLTLDTPRDTGHTGL